MINYDRVAGKIFAIIKGHGFNLSMFSEDGMDTSEPEDGRRFYVKKPNFMITLDEENDEIKINKNSNVTLEEIGGILKQMRNLAKQNLLNTQVKVFGKEIAPKDFAYQAKKYRNQDMSGMNEASLSRMRGSKKTSYQTLESVKLIVRHRKAVDEDVRGSRSRQIQAIFLEQAGERLRFPHNCLPCARAMARHMYEGGNMQDTIGEYIIESSGNMIKLLEFVRYTRTNKLINETSEDIIKVVKENIATIRKEFKGLTGAKSYAKMSESIAAREASVLEEDDTTDLQDMFTVRKFDEKIGNMLPLVKRLMNEKAAWRASLIEASEQTILMHEKEELAEEDIMEFENPMQQVGYKIGKVAKRMVENGDLSKFVGKVAGKLIEGETISDFEKTIVRNVLENAKIEESGKCDKCGCYDCTCEINKNTIESISDAFDLKMKMIEHEDIFDDARWSDDEVSALKQKMDDKQDLKNELRRIRAKGLHRRGSPEFNRIREIKKKLGQKLRGVNEDDRPDCPQCEGHPYQDDPDSEEGEMGTCSLCCGSGKAKVNEAGDYKDCPDCNGGYTQDGKDCKRCEGNGKIDEDARDDRVRTGPAAPGGLKDCPDCRGQYPNCDRCQGAGMVWDDELDEEPGDWDHGYNYEGMGNIDDDHDCTVDQGYCDTCGAWMDPAGGVHDKDEEDPAAMYEEEADHEDCKRCGGIGRGGDPDDPFSKCLACMGTGKDSADCERCKGTGSESAAGNPLATFGEDDDCVLCGGSGKEDFVKGSRQDPFSSKYNVGVEDFMDPEDYERGDIR